MCARAAKFWAMRFKRRSNVAFTARLAAQIKQILTRQARAEKPAQPTGRPFEITSVSVSGAQRLKVKLRASSAAKTTSQGANEPATSRFNPLLARAAPKIKAAIAATLKPRIG